MAKDIKACGKFGEDFTAKYLKAKGYKIVAQNFHSRFGEIDIIAQNKSIIAFVEVKTRSEGALFLPREAVDFYKQQKCVKTAQFYLINNPTELQIRFDVSEIMLSKDTKKPEVKIHNYIENAFSEV